MAKLALTMKKDSNNGRKEFDNKTYINKNNRTDIGQTWLFDSFRSFATSELVDHARTELLLDDSSQTSTVGNPVCWMLEHSDEYQQMREVAWAKAQGLHSKRKFEERLLAWVCEVVPGDRIRVQ